MRLFISGSAPLLKEVSDEVLYPRQGHRILERYGMTETVMIASNPLNGERHTRNCRARIYRAILR